MCLLWSSSGSCTGKLRWRQFRVCFLHRLLLSPRGARQLTERKGSFSYVGSCCSGWDGRPACSGCRSPQMVCANATATRTSAILISRSSWPEKAIIRANDTPAATVCQIDVQSHRMSTPTVSTATMPSVRSPGAEVKAHARGRSSRYLVLAAVPRVAGRGRKWSLCKARAQTWSANAMGTR